MIKRDETNTNNISHLVKSNVSYIFPEKKYFRPISAVIKGMDKSIKIKSQFRKPKFPDSIKRINTSSEYNSTILNAISLKCQNSTTLEKEQLHEETLQLKSIINNLRKELLVIKSENNKQESEINKKDKMIEHFASEYTGSSKMYTNGSGDMYTKAKDTNLINKIKYKYKELKAEFRLKCEESENLKKILKLTKFNELTIEIRTITDELNKIKELYLNSLEKIEDNEINLKQIEILQGNLSKQQYIINSLQDMINKITEDFRLKEGEIKKLKEINYENLENLKKIKKDLNFSNQIIEKLNKDKNQEIEIKNLEIQYELRLAINVKELNRLKNLVETKDRQIRDLESNIKRLNNIDKSHPNNKTNFNYNEIKYIQENPEDKHDNITLLLKSKLQEKIKENDKSKSKNKILQKKIEIYEKELGYKIKEEIFGELEESSNENEKDERIVNSEIKPQKKNENYLNNYNEDQLTEFSYILIKNFEAKKVSVTIAKEIIINEVINNRTCELNEIMEKLANKINLTLTVSNNDDKERIKVFLRTLMKICNEDIEIFTEKFMSIFYNVKTYSENEEIYFSKKLKKYLGKHLEYLEKNLQSLNDLPEFGYVTFLNLRKILESIKLKLKDKYVEFLIYKMKSESESGMCLYDLNYNSILQLISNAPNDSKLVTSEEEEDYIDDEEDKEESEIVITTDEFNQKIQSFLENFENYLKQNKISLRDFFKEYTYKSSDVEELKGIYNDDIVDLKLFVQETRRIGINLSNLDVYCIYTKLKLIDEYEAISLNVLENEIKNFTSVPEEKLPKVIEDEEDCSKYSFEEDQINHGFISNKNI